MLAYFYREFLPRRLWIAILGPLTLVSALNLPVSFPCRMALLSLLFPPIATYCVFYFVYSKRSFNAARFGDFSYGTYLYAFPIQQMMLASLGAAVPFWLYVPLAMIMSLIAGILSWHGIERWFNQSRATAAPRRAPTAFSTPESNANSSHS
jgi:peptidoglycan/LPS O-acetylase OafA/YrhL